MSNGKQLNAFSKVHHICLPKRLLWLCLGFFSLKCCIFALAVRELTKVQHLLNPMREFIYIQIQLKLHHNEVVCFCYITVCMGNSWLFTMKRVLNFATFPWLLLCGFLADQLSILQSLQSSLQNCFTNSKSQLFKHYLAWTAFLLQAIYSSLFRERRSCYDGPCTSHLTSSLWTEIYNLLLCPPSWMLTK